jgi:hypothetical protein
MSDKRALVFRPEIGVEFVSRALFDGLTDRTRILLVTIDGHDVALPPVEDMGATVVLGTGAGIAFFIWLMVAKPG